MHLIIRIIEGLVRTIDINIRKVDHMKAVDEGRIESILSKLTLEEKVAMIHGEGLFQSGGVKRLGIPPLVMSDGPMGVRKEFELKVWKAAGTTDDYVTYLPSNSAVAATWNRQKAYDMGRVLGAEARGRGKDVILAPGINIKRSPLCGRNFEYMSEDPLLVSELAVPLIRGIQENDVAACVKHFVANNQETDRLQVDTYIDEQALREIYFPGFKAALYKGESLTIMGAYNKLYGEHCSQSRYLLTKILRDEWGYDGAVISDWGGVHDTTEAAESGLDIEMGSAFDNTYMAEPLLKAVREGKISEECIDRKIRNILRTMLRLKMLGEEVKDRKPGAYNLPEHREAALSIARESIILLKNEDARLPIKREKLKSIAVIGYNAQAQHAGGGGSAEIKALYEISPLLGIKVKLGGSVQVNYAKGYYVPPKKARHNQDDPNASEKELEIKQQEEDRKKKEKLFMEAVKLAGRSDEVIFIGGLNHEYDTEGRDRPDMKLPYGQDELINAILDVNPNTVIVMVAGSAVDMEAWADRAKAIVWNYYNGIEGGNALADVLFGDVNPSGKLPESFPKALEDCPAHKIGEFGKTNKVTYKEGIFVGYRYYNTEGTDLRYCFGHGLSYTQFSYSNMKADVREDKDDATVIISLNIKNTGSMDGTEAVQLYVHSLRPSTKRPEHELKGFEKVYLKAGEERRLSITLDKEAFGYYDTSCKCFRVEPGEYEIQAASSSRDIRLTGTINLAGSYRYI